MNLHDLQVKYGSLDDYLIKMIERLQVTQEVIKQNIEEGAMIARERYDRKATSMDIYNIGDLVLVFQPATRRGECGKLKLRWEGPKEIVQIKSDGRLYRLKDCNTGVTSNSYIHFDRLKKYDVCRDKIHKRNRVWQKTDEAMDSQATDRTDRRITRKNKKLINKNAQRIKDELGDDWYEIKKLLGERKVRGKRYYKVLWMDGTTSWQPSENVTTNAIDNFMQTDIEKRSL